MNLSKLIKKLEELKEKHGDIPVRVQSLTHLWEPEPEVKKGGALPYVLLNP